jgi:hypothetical protein
MKRAILLLVALVGGAFYLGWFTFTTDSTGHTEHVNIEINKDKVHEDEARAIEKLHSYENQIEQQNGTSTTALPDLNQSGSISPPPQNLAQAAVTSEPSPRLAPAQYANDSYEVPQPAPSRRRPVAETAAESFSRGFQ